MPTKLLFEAFPEQTLNYLLEIGEKRSIPSGETLFTAGTISDGVYFILSGSVQVFTPLLNGEQKLITSLTRGEIAGEMSILMGRPHINTVKASRDVQAVFLSKDQFLKGIEQFPQVLSFLYQRTIQRYERFVQGSPENPIPKTMAFLVAGNSLQHPNYVHKLTEILEKHIHVKKLNSSDVASLSKENLIQFLSDLEQQYDLIIYEGDSHNTEWNHLCMRASDRIFLLATSQSNPDLNKLEQELFKEHLPKTSKRTELIILHESQETQIQNTIQWLQHRPVFLHHHVHLNKLQDFERQVRFILGKTISVALGGGGTRCFSQIGFLRAMQEENIPIDMIAGCSGGGIVASLFAMGLPPDDMAKACIEKFKKYKPLSHYNLPFLSLINSKYTLKIAEELYSNHQIEDLPLNFFCIACDIIKAQKIILQKGHLATAVMASISIPGIFPPVITEDHFLVDGGLLENLPFKSLKNKIDGKIIAIDASATEEFMHFKIPKSNPTKRAMLQSWLNPFQKNSAMPSIKDVIIRSVLIHAVQERIQAASETPFFMGMPVERYPTFDTSDIDHVIHIGYHHAKPIVANWKKQLLHK